VKNEIVVYSETAEVGMMIVVTSPFHQQSETVRGDGLSWLRFTPESAERPGEKGLDQ
jgi:hypothetical protein